MHVIYMKLFAACQLCKLKENYFATQAFANFLSP